MTVEISLREKVAVVTGAGQGIGKAIALSLRQAGAEVIVTDINVELGRQTSREIKCGFHEIDVTNSGSVSECVNDIIRDNGHVDVWVNNAGIDINAPSELMSDQQFDRVLKVNLSGVFYCSREVGKHMLSRAQGSLINIASMSGIVSNHPQPQCAYNASKAGVILLTKSLAGEWADRGVRVNSISPGYTNSSILDEVVKLQPEWANIWFSETPMKRPADPKEIANVALFLASDHASFMTGSNVVVDGGYTCW